MELDAHLEWIGLISRPEGMAWEFRILKKKTTDSWRTAVEESSWVFRIWSHQIRSDQILKNPTAEMIGLVSLFNGISTFVGYLMPKLFS